MDTVKQAEVFAAVRERFGVEREENLRLRDFPTLAHVIGWIWERTAAAQAQPAGEPASTASTGAGAEAAGAGTDVGAGAGPATIGGDLGATDRYPRRVPQPVLRPELALCKDSGVTLEAGRRVVAMLDAGGGIGTQEWAACPVRAASPVRTASTVRAVNTVGGWHGAAGDVVSWLQARSPRSGAGRAIRPAASTEPAAWSPGRARSPPAVGWTRAIRRRCRLALPCGCAAATADYRPERRTALPSNATRGRPA